MERWSWIWQECSIVYGWYEEDNGQTEWEHMCCSWRDETGGWRKEKNKQVSFCIGVC